MAVHRLVVVVSLLAACERPSAPEAPLDVANAPATAAMTSRAQTPSDPSASADTSSATADDGLPPPAPALAVSSLRGAAKCGPFSSRHLVKKDRALLDDRLRVRFFAGGKVAGDPQTSRLELERDGVAIFVGARETFQRGDEMFERRAAKAATFAGGYDAVTIPGRDPSVSIVTGMVRDRDPGRDMLAVAHGWFLDPDRNVLDVAVFVSSNVSDLDGCRSLAQQIIHTVGNGARRIAPPPSGETVDAVSYAKFRYTLPSGWVRTSSMGIHDFARISFRKRGTFPDGLAALEVGLDSHPGDWTSPGTEVAQRDGTMFGLPVQWHLTDDTAQPLFGAWTISGGLRDEDHAVASILAGDPNDRDEAIAFAQSIRVDP
jgi:hypothetical protein